MRLLVLALTIALLGTSTPAEAKTSKKSSKSESSSKKKKKAKKAGLKSREVKRCGMKTLKSGKRKKRCKWVPRVEGATVSRSTLRTEPVPRPSGEIAFEPNNKPGVVFRGNIYDEAGDFDDAVLAELDRGMVCKRTGDVRAVNPRLYQTLSTIYDHFGKKTMVLVSGHRLQTKESGRHHHAAAADIYIPGVSTGELYEYVTSLDGGGMGLGKYPRSGFVHVDFRAPGAPSYRWTDYYGGMQMRSEKAKKARDRAKKASARKKRPNA